MSTLTDSRNSPLSDAGSESGFGTLTMGEKALIKKSSSSKHDENNLRGGYKPVHEQAVPKTGLRGRKTYAFWTLVILLFFLAMGNLLLTFVILGVLRLGQGMESLELVPEQGLITFYGTTDLDRVYKPDGKLEGFDEWPVEIAGDNNSVSLRIDGKDATKMSELKMSLDNATVNNVKSFDVHDPVSGKPIFSTGFPNFGLPHGVDKLQIKIAQTRRITSSVNNSLYLQSRTFIRLKGNEGTRMEGREIVWSADQDIFLKSVNGSVTLDGHEGISINMKDIPSVNHDRDSSVQLITQYKLCVCWPGGKLYRVPVTLGENARIACHNVDFSPLMNPCI
ncbi:beta-sarcoglycan [Schistocerca americana]|uniref:beta-sarcoglycan n=1 Tax=Schistocerca americana TaxID=7009 RepID=UPI001F4F34EA|nr:beta-sarcoglycan [Schistocerca americana]XP_047112027.1 beta-sarcoglycan [Schistocerca piceifrons]